jgi:hypothetical protein
MAPMHARRPQRRFLRSRGLALTAMLLLGGCSTSKSDEEMQVKEARSAAATAQMTLEAWLAQGVPAHYARRTLAAMREKLDTAGDKIEQAGSSAPARQAMTLQPIRRTSEAIERAGRAIATSDRAGAAKNGEGARAAAASLSLPASPSNPSNR